MDPMAPIGPSGSSVFARPERTGALTRQYCPSMFRRRLSHVLLGAVAPTAFLTVASPAAAALAHGPLQRTINSTSASSNWSGYDSTSGPFSSVSASWVQPAGNCSAKKTTYAAFWVGIDGDGSNSVEQTGSEVDCRNNRPVYYAWYEMYPAYPVNYTNPVQPGDSFSASVTEPSPGAFTLTLTDSTQHWTQTQHKTLATAQSYSAEIIAEAPSSGNRVLPLTNFGTVAFTNAEANGASIGSQNPDEIVMESGTTVKAQPSALTNNLNFTVTWEHL